MNAIPPNLPPIAADVPLPDDAPAFVRAFYNAVQAILGRHPDPSAKDALGEILAWMKAEYAAAHAPPSAAPGG